MQLVKLLHKMIEKELSIHKIRLNSLMSIVQTATTTNKLYLTGLGRHMSNRNKPSSNIQKVDRLISNRHLKVERLSFYELMISRLIKENSTPWIHIDWSCINPLTNLYTLRASLSMTGRAIVIYEECYPKKRENNDCTHKEFLNNLKKLLPESSKPTIVTDAGFRGPWFLHILTLGWNFVGRLRNKNLVKINNTWKLSNTLFTEANTKPTSIGNGLLTQDLKVPVELVLYKGPNKNRHKFNINKKTSVSGMSKKHAKAHREPWVLVTSMPSASYDPKQIVNIYRQRMRIEENFRDTKCPHYGLGLKKSLSRSVDRMNALLLIATLAIFSAWLAGIFTTSIGKARDFQAHSAKVTSALSKVFLGREALRKGFNITKRQFNYTVQLLYEISAAAQMEPHVYA